MQPREPADDGAPVLESIDLVKVYDGGDGSRRALDGVSISIGRGRFLSVMGPSGSGKSTLLHILGGLDKPSAGEVVIAGTPSSRLSEPELAAVRRRFIGFVFQAYNLVPVLTVAENVALPLLLDGRRSAEAERRVAEVLELTHMSERASRLPSQLSGGEQQRTAIARALVAAPAVLLADEPTGNLDTSTGAEVLKVLTSCQRELGCSVVLVTHDPKVAAVGDSVVNLKDGLVVSTLDLTRSRQRRPVDRIVSWLASEEG